MFIGIASDEPKRLNKLHGTGYPCAYPLAEWGVTEQEALDYCYSKGLDWGGLYAEGRKRVSCYCCPLQNLDSLRLTWKYHPDLWQDMLDMENKMPRMKFRIDYTVEMLGRRFALEEKRKDAWPTFFSEATKYQSRQE